MAGSGKTARQKKREIDYALDFRDGEVFLVRRARDARLMAGMWELPEVAGVEARSGKEQIRRFARNDKTRRDDKDRRNGNANHTPRASDSRLWLRVRHSITVTDYVVWVWRIPAPTEIHGKRVAVERLSRVALTGLTRKILREAGIIAGRSGLAD
jgi:adenine-specific DNA glycosylase